MSVQLETQGSTELEEIRKALRVAQEEEDAAVCERWRALQTQSDSRTDTVSGTSGVTSDSFTGESSYEDEVTTPSHTQDEGDFVETTVLYNEGATALFLSIEESDWPGAAKLLEQHPEQASIWVESTGTVSTTFNWSLWKRLPLHEAARRQPPERFLVKLIQAFPDATRRATQFGELPIHLAVECGAEPCIVHLLALHYWPGVVQTDQSGRVALDILLDSAILDPLELTSVRDSLKASMDTYADFREQQKEDLAKVEKQNKIGLRVLRRKFDSDLKIEQQNQDKLQKQVESLKQQLKEQHEVIQSQNTAIARYRSTEEVWNNRFAQSEAQSTKWKELYRQEQASTANLVQTVAGRDDKIADLNSRLEQSQATVARVLMVHRKRVTGLLNTMQRQLSGTLSKMESLDQTLSEQSSDLCMMLDDNYLDEGLQSPQLTSSSESGAEDDVVDAEALRRAAQAASDVLK